MRVLSTHVVRGESQQLVDTAFNAVGDATVYAVSRRSSVRICPMVVLLDNVLLPTPFDLDNLPSPTNLAGIELYPGAATIPPAFASYDRGCGVIMLWTKSR